MPTESILDDLLLGISSVQLILSNNGSSSTIVNAVVNAVQVGEARYIYSVAAITIIRLVIFAEEVISTQYWRRLSKFNYNDLGNVVIATSKRGDATGIQAVGENMHWHAVPSKETGVIRIRLEDRGGVVIVANDATGLKARYRRPSSLRDPLPLTPRMSPRCKSRNPFVSLMITLRMSSFEGIHKLRLFQSSTN